MTTPPSTQPDQPTPPPPTVRPTLVVVLVVVGWLTVISLTALMVARYRGGWTSSGTSQGATAVINDIRQRLARW